MLQDLSIAKLGATLSSSTPIPLPTSFAVVLALAIIVTVGINLLRKHDPREPVLVPGSPILGHLPGIWRYGTSYPVVLSARTGQPPIYTVSVLGQKIYTVNSGELAAVMSRKGKQLDAETGFIVVVFQNMLGVDKTSMKTLVSFPKPGVKGRRTPYREDMRTMEHKLLAPGESNEQLYLRIMDAFVEILDETTRGEQSSSIHLMEWLEQLYTRASGAGLYGKKTSPFESQPSLVGDYWLWDSKMSPFLLKFFPKYIVPDAFQARERLVQVLGERLEDSGQEGLTDISRQRWETSKKHGLSRDYLGRSELELLNGLLSNTAPAVFWILAHISITGHGTFSKQIDEEIGDFVHQDGHQLRFDSGQIRQRCPVLVATYQEVLRLYASSARAYKVVEDFKTPDGCLLKTGNLVYVPTETIHKNPKNWGADVLQFRPDRWLKLEHEHHPGSYAPFGVGTSICPGRHFVFDMILGSLVVLLYSFDLQAVPSPGSDVLKVPERRSRIMSGMRLPIDDVDVLLRRKAFADDRQDGSTLQWSFERLRGGRNGKDNSESTGKTP